MWENFKLYNVESESTSDVDDESEIIVGLEEDDFDDEVVEEVVEDVPVVVDTPAKAGKTHVVSQSDTWWSIASKYLGDGRNYKKVVAANPGVRLEAGAVVVIPDKFA